MPFGGARRRASASGDSRGGVWGVVPAMRTSLIGTTLVLSLALAPLGAGAACVTSKEKQAFQVRALQTELMMSALTCRTVPNKNFISDYNAVIKTHGTMLATQARVLQGYFRREYGGQGDSELDKFVTSLGNKIALRSMRQPTYCTDTMELTKTVEILDPKKLVDFAVARNPEDMPTNLCASN